MTKEQKIIEQIHNEFDSAQERLLQEALDILSKPSEIMIDEYASRLEKIGFINTKSVKEKIENDKKHKVHELEKVKNHEQAELIQYYKITYPFLKFLTEHELDRICTKYNLIHAPVANYIGEVPEKNVSEIERCQILKEHDSVENIYTIDISDKWNKEDKMRFFTSIGMTDLKFTKSKVKFLCNKYLGNEAGYYIKNFAPDDNTWSWKISSAIDSINPGTSGLYDKIECENISGLFIAAPADEFNLNGLAKTKSGWKSLFQVKVKDPIVFRYVRGGIQVITKWGLEANDQALVVPKLN